jgi:hypothetical protein
MKSEVGGAWDSHGRGEENVEVFGGKSGRKETTQKTETWMAGWDKSGS